MQARWPRGQVRIEGDATEYVRISDEGEEERSFFFCPRCGATVYWWLDPERIAVPVGAFADPNFPAPRVSVWEDSMHPRAVSTSLGSLVRAQNRPPHESPARRGFFFVRPLCGSGDRDP